MIVAEAEINNQISFRENEKACCPLCGSKMHRTDTPKDKSSSFIWLECDQKYCSGWLVQTTNWFQE